MKRETIAAALLGGLILAGCTRDGIRTRIANYDSNRPELSQPDVTRFVSDQNRILADFAALAGTEIPPPGGEWRRIVDAGIHYADVRCDRFMDSLFWYNRVRETTSRQIQFTGAAASAALAILKASADAVGLTPLGFTFLDQTVNNFGAGLLFNLSPANVRVLVERKQTAYIASLSESYTNRATALQVIQNYAAICLPPSIETEVEQAIARQEYDANVIAPGLPPGPEDRTPEPFGFADKDGQPLAEDISSNWITVRGIGSSAPISITEPGRYRIRLRGVEGEWTAEAGTVAPNAMVQVQVTTPDEPGEVSTTLTIGGVPGSFTVRTAGVGETAAAITEEAPPAEREGPAPTSENQLPNPQPRP